MSRWVTAREYRVVRRTMKNDRVKFIVQGRFRDDTDWKDVETCDNETMARTSVGLWRGMEIKEEVVLDI